MIEFHRIWIDQCEAARDITEAFGVDKAIGYLIGEKFLNFLQVSDRHPRFVEEIKQTFEPAEIRAYLGGARRVVGHTPLSPAAPHQELPGASFSPPGR
jgi:hypothetical protein